jgi:protease-4
MGDLSMMELTKAGILALFFLSISVFCFGWYYYSLPKIAVIKVEGSIENFYTYNNLTKAVMRDDSIKAVILVIDSPGGTVQACFQAEQAVKQLRAKKPVVVSMGQQATSGAYLVSSAANYIYAYDYTLTGGLGVIAIWVSYENYLQKEGITYYVWKSGGMKDLGAEYRGPTEEENQYLQELVDNIMDELLNRITTNRPQIRETDRLREGMTFYGKDAKNYGLIDEIGDFEAAERKAASLAGLKDYKLVTLG